MRAPRPPDEKGRLEALRSLGILDTPPDPYFDDLVAIAARVCGTPVSLVSLVDEHRQWFKARYGLEAAQTPRDVAFCAHAILGKELFEVPDSLLDDRFATNPLVTGEPGIRFYAGAPLVTADGHALGTLCVVDRVPRTLDTAQRETLSTLARAVATQLDLRRALAEAAALAEERARTSAELREATDLLAAVSSISSAALADLDLAAAFEKTLEVLLRVTGSEFGFVGEILRRPDGAPYLKTHALTNIAWDEETRRLYDEHAARGMEFGNLATLFGAVMTSGEPVVANDPGSDPRRGGLPEGHPPLRAFLGVPFRTGGELSGMIGVANAPGGYGPETLERIGPILGACGSFMGNVRRERERRAAEEALRAGELRLRLALSAAQAGAWEWDFREGRGFWSEEDYRLLGYPPASVAPSIENLLARVHPDDLDRARGTLERAVSSGGPFECEYRVVRPDGAVRWVRDVGNVETDAAGRPLRVLGIATDVTGRKLAERELLERGNELSAANAQLERAARLKDEFLAAMSHELRTPLNAVLGLSEGLAAGAFGPLTPEQEENVELIEDSGRHLLDLINGILDLSKIGAGKLTLSPGPVDPSSVCEASLRMVREAALRKRIRISTRFDPGLSWVVADQLRLRQILVNLLGNAVKFTPEGGSVSVETSADPDGGRACFSVRDDGIGIAPEDLPRLFQPFVQLDSRLSREHAGTGLGLSLVLRLAELHGGGVSVETSPGAGSRFTVALPWTPEEQESLAAGAGLVATPARASAPPPSRAPTMGDGQSPLVLVADDHEAAVAALQGYLAAAGYRVAVARSGPEAVERALAVRPDLVLMDVQMPGLDGLEATRRIRRQEAGPRVPIVALTALVTADDRERSLAAGVDDFLAKPVPLARLAEVVAAHLRRSVARAGARGAARI